MHLYDSVSAAMMQDGSVSHRYFSGLLSAPQAADPADLADIAHFLCLMHGHLPSIIDHASGHSAEEGMRKWLVDAGKSFAGERALLTKLTVAAGPIVSTVGQEQCNTVVTGARGALEMLAQSDRNGCAFGTAYALVAEWAHIRIILDHIALRTGIETRASTLPDTARNRAVLNSFSQNAAICRAAMFGVTQMLTQHRAIWDLMEARHDSRRELLL